VTHGLAEQPLDGLDRQKPVIDMAGLSFTVATLTQMQQSTNGALIKAVTYKVPAPAQGLARQAS